MLLKATRNACLPVTAALVLAFAQGSKGDTFTLVDFSAGQGDGPFFFFASGDGDTAGASTTISNPLVTDFPGITLDGTVIVTAPTNNPVNGIAGWGSEGLDLVIENGEALDGDRARWTIESDLEEATPNPLFPPPKDPWDMDITVVMRQIDGLDYPSVASGTLTVETDTGDIFESAVISLATGVNLFAAEIFSLVSDAFDDGADGDVQRVTLDIDASSGSDVGLRLESISVETAVVPVPAAAWLAAPLLGGLGLTQAIRRRRAG